MPSPGGWTTAARLAARLELRRAVRRPRLFVMNVVIPLALVTPIALGGAPPQHAAAVYTVLFVLFATFGSAIPVLRDGERGLIRRLTLTAARPAGLLVGRLAAGALLDLVQLLPAAAIIAVTGPTVHSAAGLLLVLAASLLIANVLGAWVAAIARSVAEGALLSAVSALLLLHASGVFRTPLPGSMGERVEAVAPFRALHEGLVGQPANADAALVVFAAIATLVTFLVSGPMLRSIARADGR